MFLSKGDDSARPPPRPEGGFARQVSLCAILILLIAAAAGTCFDSAYHTAIRCCAEGDLLVLLRHKTAAHATPLHLEVDFVG